MNLRLMIFLMIVGCNGERIATLFGFEKNTSRMTLLLGIENPARKNFLVDDVEIKMYRTFSR